jgi:hypothetical protein
LNHPIFNNLAAAKEKQLEALTPDKPIFYRANKVALL